MKQTKHRILCALCAVMLLVSTAFPAAAFAEQPGETAAPAAETLSSADVREMQQADTAVTALTGSDAYAAMDPDQRQQAAVAELFALVQEGLVSAGSIHLDGENKLVSFSYPCGVLGGIWLEDPMDEDLDAENAVDPSVELQLPPDLGAEMQYSRSSIHHENQMDGPFGKATIYYAFDNTINSSRYPYYSYMKGFWSAMGLETKINTAVTVADLKKMGDNDLSVLSTHGSYYTYTTGRFWKRTRTTPIILLTEESTFSKDLRYGFDLLDHRIIKVNGHYCITADFFRNAYKGGKLANTIVYSETCEFLGVDGSEDNAMADALLSGGANAVVGYVNNVYTVYSRSMLWDTVNHLILGQNIGAALEHAKATYGEDDLVWYHSQGGLRPHAAASYAVLYGSSQAALSVPAANRAAALQAAA